MAALLLATGTVFAGVGGSVVPTFPAGPLNVGSTFNAGPILTNDSDGANVTDTISATAFFTPSCGSGIGTCSTPDLNVFQLPATGTGAALSSCDGVTFTVGAPNVTTGEVALTPVGTTLSGAVTIGATSITVASAIGFIGVAIKYLIQIDSEIMLVTAGQGTTTWTVTRGVNGTVAAAHISGAAVTQLLTLGPSNASAGPTNCQIVLTAIKVLRVPTIDASANPGIQTTTLGRATFTNGTLSGSSAGTSQTTIIGPTVTLTKNPKAGIINAGQTATFTIVVGNVAGTGDATNVMLTDTLPNVAGLTWVLNPAVAGCAIAGTNPQVLSCTTLTVPAGTSQSLVVSAVTTAQACAAMPNSVSITGFNNGPPITSLIDTGLITCQQVSADLSITKTDGVTTVNAGGTTTYTVVVTNNGPSAANGAVVTDPVATGLSKTAAACTTTTNGAVCPATVTPALLEGAGVVIPTLPSGGTVTFTVTATVTAGSGSVTNIASVAAPAGTTDPTPGNNTAMDTGTVQPVANLSITKTDGVTSVNVGGTTTYTVVVTNSGPSAADGAVVTDPVAAGMTKTAAACTTTSGGAVCPATVTPALLEGAGVVIPTLPSGGSVTFTIAVNVTATSGSITNTVSVAPPQGTNDPSLGNNTTSDTDTITLFTLLISKTPSSQTLATGSPVSFTIVATNSGPASASGSVLTDPVIAGFTAASISCSTPSGGAVCPLVANVTLGNLQGAGIGLPTFPATGSLTFTLSGTFTAASGNATNTATLSPPPGVPVTPVSAQATVSVPNVAALMIPTLSDWVLLLLASMLFVSGFVLLRRKQS